MCRLFARVLIILHYQYSKPSNSAGFQDVIVVSSSFELGGCHAVSSLELAYEVHSIIDSMLLMISYAQERGFLKAPLLVAF